MLFSDLSVNTTYSHVCGYARGYQYHTMDAFWRSPIRTINDSYIDGLSITHGNPRKPLWTLAVGNTELSSLHTKLVNFTLNRCATYLSYYIKVFINAAVVDIYH